MKEIEKKKINRLKEEKEEIYNKIRKPPIKLILLFAFVCFMIDFIVKNTPSLAPYSNPYNIKVLLWIIMPVMIIAFHIGYQMDKKRNRKIKKLEDMIVYYENISSVEIENEFDIKQKKETEQKVETKKMITREELELSVLDIENRKKDEKKVTQAIFDIQQFLKKMRPMGYLFTQEELDEQDEAVTAFQKVKEFIESKIEEKSK